MNNLYAEKVAIVTGGASGIGRAVCELLAARGASVVVADVNGDGAGQVAEGIAAKGAKAKAAILDVTDAEAVQRLIEDTACEHGRLDYLFNNAGVTQAAEARDLSAADWRRVIEINLMGVIHGVAAAYPLMVEQGFGHIVNTASVAGLIGCPTATPYAASKYAVVGLSTSLRCEAADLGVKVSVVCPGFVDTAIYESAQVVNADRRKVYGMIPVKMMAAHKAARAILRGVAKNRAVIVFPFTHGRLPWWLHRLHPALLAPFGNRLVRGFRRLRKEP